MEEEKRKRPPSYYKYRRENPTVSFTLTKKLRDNLDRYRKSKGLECSYGRAVQYLISEKSDILRPNIQLVCPKCKETVVIRDDHEKYQEIIDYLAESFFTRYKHRCQAKRKRA